MKLFILLLKQDRKYPTLNIFTKTHGDVLHLFMTYLLFVSPQEVNFPVKNLLGAPTLLNKEQNFSGRMDLLQHLVCLQLKNPKP